jgi:hypothetical protein
MDWLWQNLFSWLVVEVILVAGGAAAFGYIKRKLPEQAPTLAYAAFGAICVSILIFTFTGRGVFSKTPPSPVTSENVEQNIKVWAEHLGMSIGPANEGNSYFAHTLTLGANTQAVEVFRSNEKPGYLQFKAIITVAPEQQAAFAKMSQDQVGHVVEQINLEVARANLGCTFGQVTAVNDQLHQTIIGGAFLQRGVPIQNLSESYFGDTFDQVTRGSAIVSSSIRLAMPPSPDTSKQQTPTISLH